MSGLVHRPTSRRIGTSLLAAGIVVTTGALTLGPGTSGASSHREAPLTAGNPLSDNTDTYVFVSPDDPETTTLIANWIPFQEPAGGPNFYPWGSDGYRYNIKVDNDGDAVPDTTYQWTFTDVDARGTDTFLYANGAVDSFDDENLLFKQTYDLVAIPEGGGANVTLVDNGPVAPSHVGDATFPDYQALRDEAVIDTVGGVAGSSFVGQADDSFFLDLRVFDLLYGGDLSEVGSDTLTNYNVNSIALQLPTTALTAGGDDSGIIGVWATTDQQTMTFQPEGGATPTGDFVQVSRLSAPLVNELIIPAGLKDAFNALAPENDASVQPAVDRVNDPEVPRLIEALYGIPAPATPRDDLFAAFLTGIPDLNQPPEVTPAEMLRLNTAIPPTANPNRLGVLAMDNAGFPNGRRLTDDVVDIELQALEGAIRDGIVPALAAGDGVDVNDEEFGDTFPYLALPTSGSTTEPRGTGQAAAAPTTSAEPAPSDSATPRVPQGGVATGAGGASDTSTPLVVLVALIGVGLAGTGVVLRGRKS